MMSAIRNERSEARRVLVTFDRRRRHSGFAYGKFNLVLGGLYAISGGSGITRSVSQLRVLRWRGIRRGLRRILEGVARHNRELRFRRLLVMRYDAPEVGYRLYDS